MNAMNKSGLVNSINIVAIVFNCSLIVLHIAVIEVLIGGNIIILVLLVVVIVVLMIQQVVLVLIVCYWLYWY